MFVARLPVVVVPTEGATLLNVSGAAEPNRQGIRCVTANLRDSNRRGVVSRGILGCKPGRAKSEARTNPLVKT